MDIDDTGEITRDEGVSSPGAKRAKHVHPQLAANQINGLLNNFATNYPNVSDTVSGVLSFMNGPLN